MGLGPALTHPASSQPSQRSCSPEGVEVAGDQLVDGCAAATAVAAAARGVRGASRHLFARRPPPTRQDLRRRGGRGPRRGLWELSGELSTFLPACSGRGALRWQQRRKRGGEGVQDAARGGPVPPCPVTAAAAAAGTGPGPGAAARAAVAAAAAGGAA